MKSYSLFHLLSFLHVIAILLAGDMIPKENIRILITYRVLSFVYLVIFFWVKNKKRIGDSWISPWGFLGRIDRALISFHAKRKISHDILTATIFLALYFAGKILIQNYQAVEPVKRVLVALG
jgi:hypothetical protein